jgi:PPOX class probable F420-dependent enzyme
VWVVTDDGRRLLVWTGASTWKVQRIQRDPRALVAASNFRGTERGERIAATARLADVPGMDELLRRKYGWQKRLVDFLNRKSRPGAWTAIEIADA